MVPPGVLFLLDISRFSLPPLVLHLSLRVLSDVFSWTPPTSMFVAIWLFTLPVYIQARVAYTRFVQNREARRLGAELVPSIQGKWPGNLDILYRSFRRRTIYIGEEFARYIKEHGTTFSISTMGDLRIMTIHPENIKRILATDFDNYVKGKAFNTYTKSMLGVGVFNSDGEMWQFHRKITRPLFGKERITDFQIFDNKAQLAIRRMQETFDQGLPMDFQDICSRFTLDSACEFLLGTSIHSLEDPLPQPGAPDSHLSTPGNRFSHAFADAQTVVSSRGRLGRFWRLREFFKDKTDDDMVILRAFIEPIVKGTMRKRGEGGSTEKEGQSLLEHLVNVTDDMKLIVDEVLNIMLAGRDTTAALLTFVTYCLAMHPDVLARLREEIISTIGKDNAPSFDDLRSLKYLRAVLNETLRLFSPVPFNVRQTIKATTWVSDEGKKLYIPPNTRVSFSFINMHRHEAYWGPDVDRFDPDRFLDERVKKTMSANPFVFLPFNAGPRICLGQQFAYHEASFFVVRMLQRFEAIELVPEAQPPKSRPPAEWATDVNGSLRKKMEQVIPRSHLTLYADGGLWVKMRANATRETV